MTGAADSSCYPGPKRAECGSQGSPLIGCRIRPLGSLSGFAPVPHLRKWLRPERTQDRERPCRMLATPRQAFQFAVPGSNRSQAPPDRALLQSPSRIPWVIPPLSDDLCRQHPRPSHWGRVCWQSLSRTARRRDIWFSFGPVRPIGFRSNRDSSCLPLESVWLGSVSSANGCVRTVRLVRGG